MKLLGAGLASALVVSGCTLPVATVPAVPLAGRGAARVEQDRAECERFAKGREPGHVAEAACLLARGYRTYTEIPTSNSLVTGQPAQFWTIAKKGQGQDQALADLLACRRAALGEIATGTKVMTGTAPSVVATVGARLEISAVEKAYLPCMAERGYRVTRWQPE